MINKFNGKKKKKTIYKPTEDGLIDQIQPIKFTRRITKINLVRNLLRLISEINSNMCINSCFLMSYNGLRLGVVAELYHKC